MDALFSMNLSVAAQSLNAGVFQLPEVIFCLGVTHTEKGVSVSDPMNVGDAPFVATNGGRCITSTDRQAVMPA